MSLPPSKNLEPRTRSHKPGVGALAENAGRRRSINVQPTKHLLNRRWDGVGRHHFRQAAAIKGSAAGTGNAVR